MQPYPWHPYQTEAEAGAAVAAVAARAPPVSAAALTTPMRAFRILVDARMQCSFVRPAPPCSRLVSSICPELLMGCYVHLLRELHVSCGYACIPVVRRAYL